MNDPILIITALAPGIIGIAVQKLLRGDVTEEPFQKGILKYFLYAASALFLTDMIAAVKGVNGPVGKILSGAQLSYFDFTLPMLSACVIAIIWHVIGSRFAIWAANQINKLAGRNPIFLDQCMLETMLSDNQPHFLEIQFADGRIEKGFVSKAITHEKTIMLEPDPDWTNDTGYERHIIRKMINLEMGIVITEYEYRFKCENADIQINDFKEK